MQCGTGRSDKGDAVKDRHLSWTNLSAIIERGHPARLSIPGEPKLDLLVEAGSALLALLAPVSSNVVLPASPLEEIRTEKVELDGKTYLLVGTATKPLFREFYGFLATVADLIQQEHRPPLEALQKGLESWRKLLRSATLLTAEQEMGLFGELWLLTRLIQTSGPEALDGWTGPLAEPHDFRFGQKELEVKSTRRRERTHMISSLNQLVPSHQRELFLLSLQFEPTDASGGRSLAGSIARIREMLAADPIRFGAFNKFLESTYGYRDEDSAHYGQAFQLRSVPILIPVNMQCPKLTRTEINAAMPEGLIYRLVEVHYMINVDGLGYADGTPGFLSIIPPIE